MKALRFNGDGAAAGGDSKDAYTMGKITALESRAVACIGIMHRTRCE